MNNLTLKREKTITLKVLIIKNKKIQMYDRYTVRGEGGGGGGDPEYALTVFMLKKTKVNRK